MSSKMFFVFFLALFHAISLSTSAPFEYSPVQSSYDYIIVGGGTAGLTLASRLSENPHTQIAVIEAGGYSETDSGNKSIVPGYAGYGNSVDPATANDTLLIDWGFVTAPMAGLNGRTIHYPRGKTVGGSSTRNSMVYHRGTVNSYDRWAELVEDSSYTFANLLPFFRKSVHYSPPNTSLRAANASVPDPSVEAYSPLGGPLGVSHANWAVPITSYASQAFASIGIPTIQDFSSGTLLGAQYTALTISSPDEERSSSESSFLRAAQGRKNLKVYSRTLAKRILFEDNQAMGVLVQTANGTACLTAKKEVILSAGAFQSPQLLMVSGIGPEATLRKLKIPIVAIREGVGQNMWDQPSLALIQQVNVETQSGLTDPSAAAKAAAEYIANRTGILTSGGVDYIGWEKLPPSHRVNLSSKALEDLATFPPDWPETEMAISATGFSGGTPGLNYGFMFANLGAPLSRGNVTIVSADTTDLPIVNPNYLSSETDQEVAVQLFRRLRALLESPSFAPILVDKEISPGVAVQTDEEILAYLKGSMATSYHVACTCAMGKRSDPKSVVDSHARVIGVQGLRVVDASSFPLLPPGHPSATIYALAEKIAADILNF